MLRLMFSRQWWWTTLLALAGIAFAARMGFWQLERMAQGQAQDEQLRAVQAMPRLDLGQETPVDDLLKMEYRPVEARGRYDFARQVAIRNQVWTQTWGDEPGYALLTPLLMENGPAVWVERGWIPAEADDPAAWRQYDEPGLIHVQGIIRLAADKTGLGGVPDPTLAPGQRGLDFWNFVNLPRLQAQLPYPALPVYIQQAPEGLNDKLPYRWLSQPEVFNRPHLGFALMWFFYALLLGAGYPVLLRKRSAQSPA